MKRTSLYVALQLFFLLLVSSNAMAADYYVSPSGTDTNPGTSPVSAWRSISRVNGAIFRAGDRILFQGGNTFSGDLLFDSNDAGSPANPITVTSYGSGRATLYSASGRALLAHNCGGYRITDLNFLGGGRTINNGSGIRFYNDMPGDAKLDFIRIDKVEVSGFGRMGIEIGGGAGTSGYRDVRITNAVSHDNARGGIATWAALTNAHQNVYVGHCKAYENTGVPGLTFNTGNGIVLGNVNGGGIERSVAHDNGYLCDAGEGPVGIWAYSSNNITIQYNESYRNRTGGPADGGGFDFDVTTSNSVMQYNYSHDNDGAGYLLAHYPDDNTYTGNVLRYNISQNDGRKNSYAGIHIWGRIRNTEIYNNTVYMSGAPTGTSRALYISNGGISSLDVQGLHIRNNIFVVTQGARLVEVTSTQLDNASDLLFQGNNYFSGDSAFQIIWGFASYDRLDRWRAATGQERLGGSAVGLSVNPGLQNAGGGGTIDNADLLDTLAAYKLQPGSPLIDAGLNLQSLFGINPGNRDYYVSPLPQGRAFDMGAHEAPAPSASQDIVLYASETRMRAGGWDVAADATAAGGARLHHADARAPKLSVPLASPTHYFEMTFNAEAGRPYRLWIRGKAQSDFWGNDSIFIQFSDSVNASGSAVYRIGTTSATDINLEDCSGCGLSGWGWQDNGWGVGVLGPVIYFQSGGEHRIRVQTKEDGLSIDQIVLSAGTYLSRSPGTTRNDSTILPKSGGDAEVELLADDFNFFDNRKWIAGRLFSGHTDALLPVVAANQRLEIGALLEDSGGSHYNGIRSASRYDFEGAYCYVELISPASAATRGNAMLTIGDDVNNYYRAYVEGPILFFQKKMFGAKSDLFSVPYDAASHRFWRIRHDPSTGNVLFETAAGTSGVPGTWTSRYEELWNTASVPLHSIQFELKGGTWQPESSAPGRVIFDSFRSAR